MIETTSTLAPFEVDDLDAETLLAHAQDAEVQARVAQRRILRLAVQWAVLHPATAETGRASWDESGLLTDETLGGDGTPAVSAFAPEPLAVALGLSPASGAQLLADALDLTHRLPHLWSRLQDLSVPSWQARQVAQATHTLSREAARWVDEQLQGLPPTARRVDQLVARAVAKFHPDRLEVHQRRGKHGHGVRLTPALDPVTGLAGLARLDATGDHADLTRFYDLVCATAHQLGVLGDQDPLGARKAKALGLIADAQAGLPLTWESLEFVPSPGPATLYLHLDQAALADPNPHHDQQPTPAIGHAERLGPVLDQQIRDWLGHAQVRITPILDLSHAAASDPHQPPAWMRELVTMRDAHCVFPGCTRASRACDLDHINPYDPTGPPGQTSPDNLAPLCRRHHRAKTARRWRYQRRPDGTYQWTTPGSLGYLVTPQGTHPINLN